MVNPRKLQERRFWADILAALKGDSERRAPAVSRTIGRSAPESDSPTDLPWRLYTGAVRTGPYPSLQLVEETVEKQLDNQIGHIDALDTKAGILFGFLAVALATAASSKDFVEAAKASYALKVAVGAIFVAFLLTLVAFAIREYRRDPNPRQLRELYPSAPEDRTRFDLADAYVVSFESNVGKISVKVGTLRATLFLAGVGGLGFAAHVVLGW